MPGEDVQSWSTTAATNATADTGINWVEGQPRASVNNSARSMMAAIAKDRNLQNGSITTGGSANAQTFLSPLTYLTTPTGLRVLLKIGFTNTGATTLGMDSITAVAVKDQAGNDLGAGALMAGQYAEFLYNGTNWILLEGNLLLQIAPACGRLTLVSTTQLAFKPYNGNSLRIAGAIYAIPSAGIAGLANTGVFVNGVAAQNLTISTLYYVYAFNNAGVITADFRVAGTNPHSPSATAGNVGTEILTGDDSRSLIGMVAIGGIAVFLDDGNARWVLSWFNRRSISLTGSAIVNATTTSTTFVELDATGRCNFLIWADEALWAIETGYVLNHTANGSNYISLLIDGTTTTTTLSQLGIADNWSPITSFYSNFLAEGNHYIGAGGAVVVGTGLFNLQMLGRFRG